MNAALQSYLDLTKILGQLCQVNNSIDFLDSVKQLGIILHKVDEYRFFPLDLNREFVDSLKTPIQDWQTDRNELCRQLYIALATLLFRFEASNIYNRAYFDYMLEYARTSLPYEIANEWGKEFVENMNFSHEGFFFAINRDTRFHHRSKDEYDEYGKKLREKKIPNCPMEKAIPDRILKDVESYYRKYYNEYCNSIEVLYPEIKDLFLEYNMHLRIYLCSYDVSKEKPKVDFVLANYYRANDRCVSVFPNYVDLAYRFCNIEEFKEQPVSGIISIFMSDDKIFNFTDVSSIYHQVNELFVKYAKPKVLCEYACYFLRGQLKPIKVLTDDILQCADTKILLCEENVSFEKIKNIQQTTSNVHFLFTNRPSSSIIDYLKSKDVPWSCVSDYGRQMINNENANMVHWFIRNNLMELNGIHVEKGGNLLIERLNNCKCGKIYWHEFELIGADIFDYLFKEEFLDYQSKLQSTTNDKIQRRDLVVNNNYKDQTSFWGRMHMQYGCNMIIVDFKNYSDGIDSDCLFNVTKYMSNFIGCFVLVFSRKGVSDSGHTEQLRLFREGKLVLCLSDSELMEMIQLKRANRNPYNVLDKLLFSLMKEV